MIYPRLESKRFMQYEVYAGSLDDIYSDSKRIVSTLNQHSFCIAEKDPEFKEALQNADILLPDGVAIVAATRLLSGTKIKKIAGSDLHENMLKYYNEIGGACFYLGSSEETLGKIAQRLKKNILLCVWVRTLLHSKLLLVKRKTQKWLKSLMRLIPTFYFWG